MGSEDPSGISPGDGIIVVSGQKEHCQLKTGVNTTVKENESPESKIIIPAGPEILAPFTPSKREECGIVGHFRP